MQIKEFSLLLNYLKYYKLIIYVLVAVIITDIFKLLSWVPTVNIPFSTAISLVLNYTSVFILAFIASKSMVYSEISQSVKFFFSFWLIWNVFNIFRGVILAENYWDLKFLFFSSILFSLISLVFFVGNNFLLFRSIFYFYLRWIFMFGFLIIPLSFVTNEELYSRLMIPISVFILFIPYLQLKWKLLIIFVALSSILLVLGFRSNLIKISISVLLLSLFYLKNVILQSWLRIVHFLLFLIPIIFLILGLTSTFNLFEEFSSNEEIIITNNYGKEENFTADTRTLLYEEVLGSMENIPEWLIGKSASGSYNSKMFFNSGGGIEGKRYRSEVNILNILLYHGIIGVIIYFFLLYKVSSIAINNSNNILSKMIGMLIASRWTLSFVEEFTQYDLNFFFFWLIMGLVSTLSFRKLNNEEIRYYFKFT